MNILMCSVGRRGELIKDFKQSVEVGSKIISTDNSPMHWRRLWQIRHTWCHGLTHRSTSKRCWASAKRADSVGCHLIDPESEILSKHRAEFAAIGVELLVSYEETAHLCFDKFEM